MNASSRKTKTSLKLRPYTELRRRHKGMSAFVVGAGTSLIGWLNHPRRSTIHDHVVLSVNSSFITMPWSVGSPDRRYWVSNDALCRRWTYWGSVCKAKVNRVVRNSWERYYVELPDGYYFWPRPTSEGVVNESDDGLAYCSSVPTSIDLALQMGCNRVFLLGVDQYNLMGRSHFWQFLPENEQPKPIFMRLASHEQQAAAFRYNGLAYGALRGYADSLGAKIYNCNPLSNVDTFDKITYDEALSLA